MRAFALITLIFASTAQAEIYKCDFSEPFYSLKVDTKTKTVSRTKPDFEGGTKSEVVASKIGVIEIPKKDFNKVVYVFGPDGKAILKMTKDKKGSDGMSPFRFPYSAENPPQVAGAPMTNHGGCQTASEPAVKEM